MGEAYVVTGRWACHRNGWGKVPRAGHRPVPPRVDSDAHTTCSGDVDEWPEHLWVDFQDGEGHFVLSVEAA